MQNESCDELQHLLLSPVDVGPAYEMFPPDLPIMSRDLSAIVRVCSREFVRRGDEFMEGPLVLQSYVVLGGSFDLDELDRVAQSSGQLRATNDSPPLPPQGPVEEPPATLRPRFSQPTFGLFPAVPLSQVDGPTFGYEGRWSEGEIAFPGKTFRIVTGGIRVAERVLAVSGMGDAHDFHISDLVNYLALLAQRSQ